MPATRSSAPTGTSWSRRLLRLVLAITLFALLAQSTPSPLFATVASLPGTIERATLDSGIGSAGAVSASAQLPVGNYRSRTARISLKFHPRSHDAAFAARGGETWAYTVKFNLIPQLGGSTAGA